jgi:hypothetical protein
MKWSCCLSTLLLAAAPAALGAAQPPYQNDPQIVKLLENLGDNTSIWLPPPKIAGLPAEYQDDAYLNRGPFTRGYGAKMPYAPDRRTAMYCGCDHNLPHYNDCWEFHLGSNTWHCLTPPDGGCGRWVWFDAKFPLLRHEEQDPRKLADLTARCRRFVEAHVTYENGYFQTRNNGGPVMAWHTWDGPTYEPRVKKLYWAVLDGDWTHSEYMELFCKVTGKDFATEKKKLKPGLGMWQFDPATCRWSKWLGAQPHPRMAGMGGTLTYIPALGRIVWYTVSTNVSPHEYAMWSYDAVSDRWADLKPNGGQDLGAALCTRQNRAPLCEQATAYSEKHDKLVAVRGAKAFLYDPLKNEWLAGGAEDQDYGVCGYDSVSTFAYDSTNDVFLLANQNTGRMWAYSIAANKWEQIEPKGAGAVKGRIKGYYDPEHNVLVLCDRGPVLVYRYRKAAR